MPRKPQDAAALTALRAEIDRIDAAMHGMLIERSEIIENLIAVKGTQASGSAFRPAREAAIMRRLAARHRGILPLDAVESIWRVIIATFTYVQAPYSVHADLTAGEAAMRDSARFHFGFTVPLIAHTDAASALAAVAASRGDLALVPALSPAGRDPWWQSLEGERQPKIIARLPFVERADHPAPLPVFTISHPTPDATTAEVGVYSMRLTGWSAAAATALAPVAELTAKGDGASEGLALLISVPQDRSLPATKNALAEAGASVESATLVGGHATRYSLPKVGP